MSEQEGTAVAEVGDRSELQDADRTPSHLIQLAVEQGVDVETLERLMDLDERWERRKAEAAMNEALNAFQQSCPPIPRDGTAEVRKGGTLKYTYHYASLDKIVETIRPLMADHGLSYTHDAEIGENGWVEVTCTLRHVMGATREATFRGPTDTSGGKNPIQQVASARSYGRRYSLVDVLGLATEDDDDGQAAGGSGGSEPIGPEEVKVLNEMISESGADLDKFRRYMQVDGLAEITLAEFPQAVQALRQKAKKAGEQGEEQDEEESEAVFKLWRKCQEIAAKLADMDEISTKEAEQIDELRAADDLEGILKLHQKLRGRIKGRQAEADAEGSQGDLLDS